MATPEGSSSFTLPAFYQYPPYFTCASHPLHPIHRLLHALAASHRRNPKLVGEERRLQPVADTRRKQVTMWTELIMSYCRHHQLFVVSLEEPFALFQNAAIERTPHTLPTLTRAWCSDSRVTPERHVHSGPEKGNGSYLREG
jgi:hypothetical protein